MSSHSIASRLRNIGARFSLGAMTAQIVGTSFFAAIPLQTAIADEGGSETPVEVTVPAPEAPAPAPEAPAPVDTPAPAEVTPDPVETVEAQSSSEDDTTATEEAASSETQASSDATAPASSAAPASSQEAVSSVASVDSSAASEDVSTASSDSSDAVTGEEEITSSDRSSEESTEDASISSEDGSGSALSVSSASSEEASSASSEEEDPALEIKPASTQPEIITPGVSPVTTSEMEQQYTWKISDDGIATTRDPVSLDTVYTAPQNEEVTVRFTQLPETPGTLSIQEIQLTEVQQEELGAVSATAYDITSSMENGTFAYNLTLPKPEGVATVTVKYAETIDDLPNAQEVIQDTLQDSSSITVDSLDHFTIFLVSADTNIATGANTYTATTGPVISESAVGQIGLGTIILTAPSGFNFLTTASSVTATVTPASCPGSNFLQLTTGTVTPTSTTITINVSTQSSGNSACASTITFSGIQMSPTVGSPLSSGDITRSGTSVGGTFTTNTFTETAGAFSTSVSTISALPATVENDGATTSTITVTIKDAFGNPISGKTVTLAHTSGAGTPTISAASGPSSVAGVVTFTVSSTTIATDEFTATNTTDGGSLTNAATVNFVDTTDPTLAQVTPVTTPTADTTPDYTFSSTEAGTISYGGDCSSATTVATVGNNTVTFNALADGAHSNCTIMVTDAATNASTALNVTAFTVDTTAPVLAQVTPVPTPTNDTTPNYTFSSTEAGSITYGGDCSSATTVATVGNNTVTFAALGEGAHNNCTVTVTDNVLNASIALSVSAFTIDITAPVIDAHGDETEEATSAAGAAVTYTSPATTDAVDGAGTATCLPASGTTFALGTTAVTCNATDAAGNAAIATTFDVIVEDTTAPVIAPHADETEEATSAAGAAVTYTSPATSDVVDGAGTATCFAVSGTTFAIGSTVVTCIHTDAAGNAATSTTFNVIVEDTTAPVIASHSDETAEATSAAGAAVTYASPATSDAVDGASTATCLPASGSTFAIGTTTVSCNKTDAHSNVATTTTFDVIVEDTTAPVIAPHSDETVEATSAAGATVTYTSPATSDAVDGAGTASCTQASGTTFPIGTTTVSCDATDAHSNVATTTTFDVIVEDTTAPVIALHSDVTVEATAGTGATVTYTSPATSDDVDGAGTATCLPASGTVFAVGTTTVSCDATDAHSNVATTTTFDVIVEDTTAPIITLLGTTPISFEIGNSYTDSGATAVDIVDGDLTSSIVTVNPVNIGLVGSYTVTYDVTDAHSNVATQVTRTVNVTKKTTTTTLSSDFNPSQFNDTVTFTVTVSGYSPTGTVDILDGATTIGTVTLSNGSGTFVTSALSVNTHDLTASYNGDASNLTSVSSPLVQQVVNKANTTTTLTTDTSSTIANQTVTLTATMNPSTATGTISFYDGGNLLGTVTITGSGTASLAVQTLTFGSHTLTAEYSGNGNYLTSTSTGVSHTVNTPAPGSGNSGGGSGGGGRRGSGGGGNGGGVAPGAFGGPGLNLGNSPSEQQIKIICRIASRLNRYPTTFNMLARRLQRILHLPLEEIQAAMSNPASCN